VVIVVSKEALIMRNWHWLVGASVVTAAAGFAACGGSTDDNSGGSDAGKDVAAIDSSPGADTGPADAGPGPVDSSIPCVFPDADLTTISPPDAALNDAGASLGTCLACTQTKCGTQLKACNGDCTCASTIAGFYECLGKPGGSLFGCAGSLGSGGLSNPATSGLVTCVGQGCTAACGVPTTGGTDSGTDAGPVDSGSTDAKTD
jgi:hypothetical protein